jgi:glycerophosphoryl diester phosphodiesterase
VFLPPGLRRGTADAGYGNSDAEYATFRAPGVDGVFTDHPDMAVQALDQPALL